MPAPAASAADVRNKRRLKRTKTAARAGKDLSSSKGTQRRGRCLLTGLAEFPGHSPFHTMVFRVGVLGAGIPEAGLCVARGTRLRRSAAAAEARPCLTDGLGQPSAYCRGPCFRCGRSIAGHLMGAGVPAARARAPCLCSQASHAHVCRTARALGAQVASTVRSAGRSEAAFGHCRVEIDDAHSN